MAAGAAATSKVAESFSAADQTSETAQVSPRGSGVAGGPPPSDHHPQQGAMDYFREYELTFSTKPEFSLVPGPGGRGAVVSWGSVSSTAPSPAALAAASPGAVVAPETPGEASGAGAAAHVPPSGAAVIAIAGESVADRDASNVAALLGMEGVGHGSSAHPSREKEDVDAQQSNDSGKLSVEVPPDPPGDDSGRFPVVVRFREKVKRQSDAGAGGGEVFRNKMKAMATGLGNLFQGKDAGASSGASRDGTGGAVAAMVPDAFVLTFSAGSSGGAVDELPFTMVEAAGGLGVIVAAVREDYAESLVTAEEAGVVSAGTAGVVPSEVAAAAAGGTEEGSDAGVLAPGALVLRVAGQNVEGKGVERVRRAVEAAAAEHSAVRADVLVILLGVRSA